MAEAKLSICVGASEKTVWTVAEDQYKETEAT